MFSIVAKKLLYLPKQNLLYFFLTMKLIINKYSEEEIVFPNGKSLIGKDRSTAELVIQEEWGVNYPSVIATGFNKHQFREYHYKGLKIVLILDENDIVIEAFGFEIKEKALD